MTRNMNMKKEKEKAEKKERSGVDGEKFVRKLYNYQVNR